MMKFYHYTSTDKLRRIAWNHQENGCEAFKPRKRFIPMGAAPADLPEKKHELAIFGLLDPLDIKWCTAIYFPGKPLLETVLRDVSDDQLSLLEINVTPSDTNP
ncbi:MAG: hypothetical protein P4L50_14585 [Anaerolineaceae bacterium]|nr:hypothetical protein [Anaerolineaceae bacterium]